MKRTKIQTNPLFLLYEPCVNALGLHIVEINHRIQGQQENLEIFITKEDREPDTGDCSRAHRAISPLAEKQAGPLRDLNLSISTPGLLRVIKDPYEFSLFTGRTVRVYDSEKSAWISGKIISYGDDILNLGEVRDENNRELEDQALPIERIQKAKLDYRWEDANGN